MSRWSLAVLGGLLAALAASGPAAAHGGSSGPDASDYRTTVTGEGGLPGVTVRTIEAGTRLELVNRSDRPVEVLGYAGEPYLEIRPDGVWQNAASPTADPAGVADPTVPPQWRRLSTSPVARWHDDRTHWLSAALPAAAQADPTREHRVRDWTIPLRRGTDPYAVTGTLDWVPAPAPGGWWAATLLTAAAATLLTVRPGRAAVAAGTAVAGATALAYAAARQLDAGRPLASLSWAMLAGCLAVVVGGWTVRRRHDFAVGVAGAAVALFGGLVNVAAFGRAVVPVAGPGWWARLALVVVIGVGAGLAVGTVLRLRASLPGHERATLTLR